MDLSQAIGIPTGNDHTEVIKSANRLRQSKSPLIVLAIFRDTKYKLTTIRSFQATFVIPEPSFKKNKTSSQANWVSWRWVAQKPTSEPSSFCATLDFFLSKPPFLAEDLLRTVGVPSESLVGDVLALHLEVVVMISSSGGRNATVVV